MSLEPADLELLRKTIHDLNNRVGVILNTAEIMLLDDLPARSRERCKTIEKKAIDARDLLKALADRYFP